MNQSENVLIDIFSQFTLVFASLICACNEARLVIKSDVLYRNFLHYVYHVKLLLIREYLSKQIGRYYSDRAYVPFHHHFRVSVCMSA